jgi:hypothetical protein
MLWSPPAVDLIAGTNGNRGHRDLTRLLHRVPIRQHLDGVLNELAVGLGDLRHLGYQPPCAVLASTGTLLGPLHDLGSLSLNLGESGLLRGRPQIHLVGCSLLVG